mmetsp:Transcript_24147/g.29265  ORF Transcript_24147/g.29265 Transcript_24147/m.29265 type:complete len:224 (+) Transcript_24147:225-896(+)
MLHLKVLGDLSFPAITVGQQLLLVIEQFLVCLGRELRIRSLNDSINRASLLAEPAVDALGHIYIVPGGTTATIFTLLCVDGDCLSRANRLAQLARDATLLSAGITAQCVLPTETWTQGTLLERIVERDFGLGKRLEGQEQAVRKLLKKQSLRACVQNFPESLGLRCLRPVVLVVRISLVLLDYTRDEFEIVCCRRMQLLACSQLRASSYTLHQTGTSATQHLF